MDGKLNHLYKVASTATASLNSALGTIQQENATQSTQMAKVQVEMSSRQENVTAAQVDAPSASQAPPSTHQTAQSVPAERTHRIGGCD